MTGREAPNGDPLDRLEMMAQAGETSYDDDDVLALVAVARAARDLSASCTPKDPALRPIRAALARLEDAR